MLSLGLVILCVTSVAGYFGPSVHVPHTGRRPQQGYRQTDASNVFYGGGSRWPHQSFREAQIPVGYILTGPPVDQVGGRAREADVQDAYIPNVVSGYAGGRPREAENPAGYVGDSRQELEAPVAYVGGRPREADMLVAYGGGRPREADSLAAYGGGRPREADSLAAYGGGRPREADSLAAYGGGRPREADSLAAYGGGRPREAAYRPYVGVGQREADVQNNYGPNFAYLGRGPRDQQVYRESQLPLFQKQIMPPILPHIIQGIPLLNLGLPSGTQQPSPQNSQHNQPQSGVQQHTSDPLQAGYFPQRLDYYQSQQSGYPTQQPGNPPQQPGYPPQQPGYPPQQPGYPPQQPGYPPQQPGYPPQQPGYPPQQPGYPPQKPGYPPQQPGYPPQQPGFPLYPSWNPTAAAVMGLAQGLGMGTRANRTKFPQGKGSPPIVCSTEYCPCNRRTCCCIVMSNQINGFRAQQPDDMTQPFMPQQTGQQDNVPTRSQPLDQQLTSGQNDAQADAASVAASPAKPSNTMVVNQLNQETKIDEKKI